MQPCSTVYNMLIVLSWNLATGHVEITFTYMVKFSEFISMATFMLLYGI